MVFPREEVLRGRGEVESEVVVDGGFWVRERVGIERGAIIRLVRRWTKFLCRGMKKL